MHVTMYCYINLRYICCYYMCPCIANCDTCVSDGWYVYNVTAKCKPARSVYTHTAEYTQAHYTV